MFNDIVTPFKVSTRRTQLEYYNFEQPAATFQIFERSSFLMHTDNDIGKFAIPSKTNTQPDAKPGAPIVLDIDQQKTAKIHLESEKKKVGEDGIYRSLLTKQGFFGSGPGPYFRYQPVYADDITNNILRDSSYINAETYLRLVFDIEKNYNMKDVLIAAATLTYGVNPGANNPLEVRRAFVFLQSYRQLKFRFKPKHDDAELVRDGFFYETNAQYEKYIVYSNDDDYINKHTFRSGVRTQDNNFVVQGMEKIIKKESGYPNDHVVGALSRTIPTETYQGEKGAYYLYEYFSEVDDATQLRPIKKERTDIRTIQAKKESEADDHGVPTDDPLYNKKNYKGQQKLLKVVIKGDSQLNDGKKNMTVSHKEMVNDLRLEEKLRLRGRPDPNVSLPYQRKVGAYNETTKSSQIKLDKTELSQLGPFIGFLYTTGQYDNMTYRSYANMRLSDYGTNAGAQDIHNFDPDSIANNVVDIYKSDKEYLKYLTLRELYLMGKNRRTGPTKESNIFKEDKVVEKFKRMEIDATVRAEDKTDRYFYTKYNDTSNKGILGELKPQKGEDYSKHEIYSKYIGKSLYDIIYIDPKTNLHRDSALVPRVIEEIATLLDSVPLTQCYSTDHLRSSIKHGIYGEIMEFIYSRDLSAFEGSDKYTSPLYDKNTYSLYSTDHKALLLELYKIRNWADTARFDPTDFHRKPGAEHYVSKKQIHQRIRNEDLYDYYDVDVNDKNKYHLVLDDDDLHPDGFAGTSERNQEFRKKNERLEIRSEKYAVLELLQSLTFQVLMYTDPNDNEKYPYTPFCYWAFNNNPLQSYEFTPELAIVKSSGNTTGVTDQGDAFFDAVNPTNKLGVPGVLLGEQGFDALENEMRRYNENRSQQRQNIVNMMSVTDVHTQSQVGVQNFHDFGDLCYNLVFYWLLQYVQIPGEKPDLNPKWYMAYDNWFFKRFLVAKIKEGPILDEEGKSYTAVVRNDAMSDKIYREQYIDVRITYSAIKENEKAAMFRYLNIEFSRNTSLVGEVGSLLSLRSKFGDKADDIFELAQRELGANETIILTPHIEFKKIETTHAEFTLHLNKYPLWVIHPVGIENVDNPAYRDVPNSGGFFVSEAMAYSGLYNQKLNENWVATRIPLGIIPWKKYTFINQPTDQFGTVNNPWPFDGREMKKNGYERTVNPVISNPDSFERATLAPFYGPDIGKLKNVIMEDVEADFTYDHTNKTEVKKTVPHFLTSSSDGKSRGLIFRNLRTLADIVKMKDAIMSVFRQDSKHAGSGSIYYAMKQQKGIYKNDINKLFEEPFTIYSVEASIRDKPIHGDKKYDYIDEEGENFKNTVTNAKNKLAYWGNDRGDSYSGTVKLGMTDRKLPPRFAGTDDYMEIRTLHGYKDRFVRFGETDLQRNIHGVIKKDYRHDSIRRSKGVNGPHVVPHLYTSASGFYIDRVRTAYLDFKNSLKENIYDYNIFNDAVLTKIMKDYTKVKSEKRLEKAAEIDNKYKFRERFYQYTRDQIKIDGDPGSGNFRETDKNLYFIYLFENHVFKKLDNESGGLKAEREKNYQKYDKDFPQQNLDRKTKILVEKLRNSPPGTKQKSDLFIQVEENKKEIHKRRFNIFKDEMLSGNERRLVEVLEGYGLNFDELRPIEKEESIKGAIQKLIDTSNPLRSLWDTFLLTFRLKEPEIEVFYEKKPDSVSEMDRENYIKSMVDSVKPVDTTAIKNKMNAKLTSLSAFSTSTLPFPQDWKNPTEANATLDEFLFENKTLDDIQQLDPKAAKHILSKYKPIQGVHPTEQAFMRNASPDGTTGWGFAKTETTNKEPNVQPAFGMMSSPPPPPVEAKDVVQTQPQPTDTSKMNMLDNLMSDPRAMAAGVLVVLLMLNLDDD